MQPLDSAAYASVLPLVPESSQAGHMAFVHQLIGGRAPGKVLADSRGVPTCALVCPDSGFFLALGIPRRDVLAAFLPELIAWHVAPEPTVLLATTPAWREALDPFFGSCTARREFHYEGGSTVDASSDVGRAIAGQRPAQPALLSAGAAGATSPAGAASPTVLPAGFRLVRLDAQLASRFDRSGVDPWVVRIWGGPARFAAECFGWAVLRGDTVVSFCTACAIGGPPGSVEAEIEIGTAPAYQRRGLAHVVARAFLEDCRERGMRPAWTCAADNEPSRRLAERLGFREFRQVRGYPLDRRMRKVGGRWVLP